ncbi:MAG TPA: hypothetical protein ENN56_04160 [Firmicutes bacterium]|nr:hypothetical protein [Bacillota bacterium]
MARRISETLRKTGMNVPVEFSDDSQRVRHYEEREDRSEETEHDRYRRKQARLAEQDTSTSLPIKVVQDEVVKPKAGTRFEGPIEKLIETYKDPREVVRHMTMGQYMRYELRGGQIWEGDSLIYDGTAHLQET